MALTIEQLSDLRADLGDTSATPAFADAELERLYVRSGEDYASTVLFAIDQLLMNAAKLNDYTAGQTQERKSQVFANLQKMREIWAVRAPASASGGTSRQVRVFGLRTQPKPKREAPYTE